MRFTLEDIEKNIDKKFVKNANFYVNDDCFSFSQLKKKSFDRTLYFEVLTNGSEYSFWETGL